jgi:hypothetical protein
VHQPCAGAIILVVWLGGCSWRAPNRALGNIPDESEQNQPTMTRVSFGTPVQVELQQDLNGYESGTIKNVRLRVLKSVWVGDFIVVEEGAEATAAASIKTPGIGVDGEISLQVNSAASATGVQIPVFGSYTATGSIDCPFYWDCIRYLWTKGGYARIRKGCHFEIAVGAGVELPNDALQSVMNSKFAATNQAITRCDHVATLRVYLLAEDAEHAQETFQGGAGHHWNVAEHAPEIFLDGKEVGRVPPSSALTLVPAPGSHVISTKHSSVTFEVKQCTPYYVRILKVKSGRKTSLAVKLVALELGEYETRDLREVVNPE